LIVVDTSALIAAILNEPMGPACRAALSVAPDIAISAGTLIETLIVTAKPELRDVAEAFLDDLDLTVFDVTARFARAAGANYRRWGKGFHAAKLNMGDSYAYTLAQQLDRPLLYVGNDFPQTDVRGVL
jgi:ribonuclease VapC